jgi:hypothetical protein
MIRTPLRAADTLNLRDVRIFPRSPAAFGIDSSRRAPHLGTCLGRWAGALSP